MIIHLVFFKMLPQGNGVSGEDNARALVAQLRDLPEKIPEIVELEAGLDFSRTPASYEVGLLTKFASREDLETYRIHPDHQKVIKFVQQTTADRAVVDYEI